MVRFLPFDRTDEEGMNIVLQHIDFSIQYGEDLEVKEPKVKNLNLITMEWFFFLSLTQLLIILSIFTGSWWRAVKPELRSDFPRRCHQLKIYKQEKRIRTKRKKDWTKKMRKNMVKKHELCLAWLKNILFLWTIMVLKVWYRFVIVVNK